MDVSTLDPRQQVRQLAVQLLFSFEAQQELDLDLARDLTETENVAEDVRNSAIIQAQSAWKDRKTADDWVTRLAPAWPTHRQPGVDRALLRFAMWELSHTQTPPKVVIDQAIEIARSFSTEHSPAFVNGVLDGVLKEIRKLKAE